MTSLLPAGMMACELVEQDKPFGCYIHVPYCISRCGYCDFNTYALSTVNSDLAWKNWLMGVKREIDYATRFISQPIGSIFFGGGTPSLAGAAIIAELLDYLRAAFGVVPDSEITIECNPDTVDQDFFDQILSSGCTRVSIGMQSYVPHVLSVLERDHLPDASLTAVAQAHAAGFRHISLDVMYGTPGESAADLALSIDAALSVPIDHLSAYSLVVEKGTALARKVRRGEIIPQTEDICADYYELIEQKLVAQGFLWYEISNWALGESAVCQHNLGYWRGNSWWGFGPGAHSYLGDYRWWNHKKPQHYYDELQALRLPIAGYEKLGSEQKIMENIMLELRLSTGIALAGLNANQQGCLRDYEHRGYGEMRGDRVVLTLSGRLIADKIITDLITLV